MHILVTGAAGFVAPYAARALRQRLPESRIFGASRAKGALPDFDEIVAMDVCDGSAVREVIKRVRPTHVLHLAAIAAPSQAASDPELAWRVNVFGTLNIAKALLAAAPKCALAHVGSGLIYGDSARAGNPLDESALPVPLDDYGVTKIAADMAVGALARKGLRAIRLRPFNHSGPGQSEDYVVPAFAMQIAQIEAGRTDPVLRVGNLEAERDFLDVRDVADAYALVLSKSATIPPGAVFNIASGCGRSISSILETLLSFSHIAIRVEQDAMRMRPSEISTIVGDATKAHNDIGWSPHLSFDQTLRDVLEDSRRRVGKL